MVIQFNCQYCDKFLKVKDDAAGRKVKCPDCKMSIEVPHESDEKKYVIKKGDGQIGPIGFIEVADMVTKGNLKGSDMVAVFGSEAFKTIKEFSEFENLTKMASQKAMVHNAKKGMGLLFKIGLGVAAVILFFVGKEMWTVSRINSHGEKITASMTVVSRECLKNAQAQFEVLKQEIPSHRKVTELEKKIAEFEAQLLAQEQKEYKDLRKKVEESQKKVEDLIAEKKFNEARTEIGRLKVLNSKIGRIPIMKEESRKPELAELAKIQASYVKKVEIEYDKYNIEQIKEIDKKIFLGDLRGAKLMIAKVQVIPGLSAKAKMELQSVKNKLRKSMEKPGSAVAGTVSPEEIAKDLISDDSAKIYKAFKTVLVKKAKLQGDTLTAFNKNLESYLSDRDLFYPAVDVLIFNGTGMGQYETVVAKFKSTILEGGGGKGIKGPIREEKEFAQALVGYALENGGLDKEVFLTALLKDKTMVKPVLSALGGKIMAEDAVNLKNAVERIIIMEKNIEVVRLAVELLGKMKSASSAKLLTQIVNHTACSKCSYGKGKSGTSYLFEPLFCAKCRGGAAYSTPGSIFMLALDALAAIKNRESVTDLEKLAAAEEKAGRRGVVGHIRKTISAIKGN